MNQNISEENLRKIQELQIMEQNLQNIMIQKQAFQFEENEIISALEEIKTSGDEVYKIIGQVMVKSNKQNMEKELKGKKDLIELRLKNLEKQENMLKERVTASRNELLKEINK